MVRPDFTETTNQHRLTQTQWARIEIEIEIEIGIEIGIGIEIEADRPVADTGSAGQ
jgi:hypothetical protein